MSLDVVPILVEVPYRNPLVPVVLACPMAAHCHPPAVDAARMRSWISVILIRCTLTCTVYLYK